MELGRGDEIDTLQIQIKNERITWQLINVPGPEYLSYAVSYWFLQKENLHKI